jgi:hypothetical protein
LRSLVYGACKMAIHVMFVFPRGQITPSDAGGLRARWVSQIQWQGGTLRVSVLPLMAPGIRGLGLVLRVPRFWMASRNHVNWGVDDPNLLRDRSRWLKKQTAKGHC